MKLDLDTLYFIQDDDDEVTQPRFTASTMGTKQVNNPPPIFSEEDLNKYFSLWEDPVKRVCECGMDKIYGSSNEIHLDYCPKFRES